MGFDCLWVYFFSYNLKENQKQEDEGLMQADHRPLAHKYIKLFIGDP